jgi:hypothetical protein
MGSMADFMRAGSPPRPTLDLRELERRLDAPLGDLLVELSRLAYRVDPISPWAAFEDDLQLTLSYLLPEGTPPHPMGLPGVLPFAETGADFNQAGFWLDEERSSLDTRPICTLRHECRIVAPNLAGFLSLVCFAGAEGIERDRPDDRWLSEREERLEDEHFRNMADELASLPGVVIPTRPSLVTTLSPDLQLDVEAPSQEAKETGLRRVRQLLTKGDRGGALAELVRQIDLCLDIAHLIPNDRWRELEALILELRPPLPEDVRTRLSASGVRM